MKSKVVKAIVWCVFIVYLAVLLKVILFKYPIGMMKVMLSDNEMSLGQRIVYSNFIPMKSILYYLLGNESSRIAVENLLGNVIAFAPLGFLLPLLFNRAKKLKYIIIISFFVSLFFEVIQLVTSIGSFDVDDLLLNVFGAIIGYYVYKVAQYIIRTRTNNEVVS